MPYSKTSLRAEQRNLRDKMRVLGLSHRQISAEFSRRYGLRPRAAWRHAYGWSLKEAAEQINSRAADTGLDASGNATMTGPHLCEYENWPGPGAKPAGRRPTPVVLTLLAATYNISDVHDLLDFADYEHIPAADRLVLDAKARAGAPAAALAPGAQYPRLVSTARAPAEPRPGPLQASPALPPGLAPLASALLSAPNPEAANPPDRLADDAKQIWRLRQAAQYQKLTVALPRALTRARASENAATDGKSATALGALTHIYNAASSLAKSLGSFELAGIAADRALLAADRTGDPLLAGAASYRMANVLLSAGQFGSARMVAVAAADRLRPVMTATASHTAMWGALLASAAQSAARDQRAADAWELLGESKVAADLLSAEHADLFSIFGLASWLIHGVSIAADLDDGAEAIRRADQVSMSRLPSFLSERRTFLLLGKARAHLLCGDATPATETLLLAEQAAPEEVRHNPDARQLVAGLLSAGAARDKPLHQLAARMNTDRVPAGSPR